MEYEEITVQEYWGNNLESTRKAKLYSDGRLEYEPEPEPEEEDDVNDDE